MAPRTRPSTARVVDALAVSAPWALLSRFDNLSHCIEASVCGTEVLQSRGVEARCIPCSVLAWRGDEVVGAGLSHETVKKRFAHQVRIEKPTFHCAIEVENRLILDLTLGQICAFGVDVPPTFVADGGFDALFTTPAGWRFTYDRETWTPDELKQFEEVDHAGLTADLADLVALALTVEREEFFELLPRITPTEVFDKALQRILDLHRKAGSPST